MSTKTLKYGSSGEAVKEMQAALKALGFFKGDVLGNFKDQTLAAVKMFQLARGLKVDGIFGPDTQKELLKSYLPTKGKLITKNLVRKLSDRKVPEELRAKIESFVFPGGSVPAVFIEGKWRDCARLVMNAMIAMEIREVGGNNMGYWVGLIQSVLGKFTTTGSKEPWCMSTIQILVAFLEDYFETESQVYASEHCMTTLRQTKVRNKSLVSLNPSPGSIIIWEHGNTDSGHTELILKIISNTKPGKIETGGGNTSDSSFRDGDGLYRKNRTLSKDGDMSLRGFIDIYPQEIVPTHA